MAITACRECQKPISSEAAACPHCGAKPREKTGCLGWIGAIAFGTVIIGIIMSVVRGDKRSTAPSASDIAETMYSQARAGLTLKSMRWTRSGFGNVLLASFVISNKSKYRVRDIRVRCTTFAQSGTHLSIVDQVVYQTIMPAKSLAVSDLNMGLIHSQSRTADCEITDFSLL